MEPAGAFGKGTTGRRANVEANADVAKRRGEVIHAAGEEARSGITVRIQPSRAACES